MVVKAGIRPEGYCETVQLEAVLLIGRDYRLVLGIQSMCC